MVQHPIPRQITTFEFKLIGFLTLKQFLYLVVFIPLGFIVYKLIPVPILNIIGGSLFLFFGAAFAFVPINDRPFDVWIKNLFKRLSSPTQFIYKKDERPLYFLEDLYFLNDPHIIATHIESKEKLKAYLNKTGSFAKKNPKKQEINNLLVKQTNVIKAAPPAVAAQISPKKPFLAGILKNRNNLPLSGLLVYIKDQKGTTIRLLKSNVRGVFATFNPLMKGEYNFEIKDPINKHFFDTMKIRVEDANQNPLEFVSKELL